MKKTCVIALCILMSAYTAFAQAAVSSAADTEIATEQNTEAVGNTADGVTEPVSTARTNAAAESSSTEPVTVSERTDEAQAQQDVPPAEKNEPAPKARVLSMHSGLSIAATGAQNAFSIQDFFQKELVIDFNKLSDKTIKSGLHAGALFNFDWFFWFTVHGEHTIKFSTTANVDVWANVSKSVLDFIAKGNMENAEGKTITGAINAKLNAFADTGIMYQLTKPKYGFSARVAYFVPIAYMENPKGTVTLTPKTNSSGDVDGLLLKAEGTANIYGYLPAMAIGKDISIPELFKNGGLDLSLAGSYTPTKWVTITGGVNYLPLMVVHLNTGIKSTFTVDGKVDNLLDTLLNKKPISSPEWNLSEPVVDLPDAKIMRPCKIKIGADFRPLENDYLILSPFLAFPVINAKPYYIDGGLKLESRFAKVLGAYLNTEYVERIWRHELCFFIASRGFTFNLAASVASQDFLRTFTTLSGVGIKFGVGIGF